MSKKIAKNMSTTDAAYLAGLVDGEGTITLTYKQKNAQRHLAVTISSTEYGLLEHARRVIGVGKITRKTRSKDKHSPSFAYQIYSRQALDVLRQITPFLRGYKKGRATFALNRYVALTPRNGKYSPTLLKQRLKFAERFLQIKPGKTKTLH